MKRRKFLGLLGATGLSGLSGCVDPVQNAFSPTDQGHTRIENIRTDVSPVEFNLQFTTEVEDRVSTESNPMGVSIALRNDGSNNITVAGSNNEAFSSQESTDGNLLLVEPTFWDEELIVSGNCWKMKKQKPILSTESQSTFRPSESESETYHLIGSPFNDGCIPPGSYRFETEFQIIVGKESQRRVNGEFTWGFVVEVSNAQK